MEKWQKYVSENIGKVNSSKQKQLESNQMRLVLDTLQRGLLRGYMRDVRPCDATCNTEAVIVNFTASLIQILNVVSQWLSVHKFTFSSIFQKLKGIWTTFVNERELDSFTGFSSLKSNDKIGSMNKSRSYASIKCS